VRGGGDHVSIVEGAGDNAGRNEPTNVGHVGQQVGALVVGNLPERYTYVRWSCRQRVDRAVMKKAGVHSQPVAAEMMSSILWTGRMRGALHGLAFTHWTKRLIDLKARDTSNK
jgi:hypothetical protein